MKKKTILLILLFTIPMFGQKELEKRLSQYVNPNEIVSLAEHIPFDKAIEVLSKVSEKITGKSIILSESDTEPIGIEITRMPYMRALNIIVNYHKKVYIEDADKIVVKLEVNAGEKLGSEVYAPVDSREVKISAIFFEANISDMKERGIDWEMLIQKTGLSFGAKLTSFTQEQATTGSSSAATASAHEFTLGNSTSFEAGDFSGDVVGAFKFFETNGLGELIARPTITVRDKTTGRIQIGSDISIKERDFSGNIIDRFYSTGTIVEVKPYFYNEEGVDYILLKLQAERSSANPGEISTEIRKTVANTEVLMLDGEETIIGGLFTNEEVITRSGIPFLKDLPWWVFGIRYLTGSDVTQIIKREIIILIDVEIIPPLKERIANKKEDLIRKSILENNNYIKDVQKQNVDAHIEQNSVDKKNEK
ncbi:MAG: type II and III secretion system protein [Bacteroidetes bacterium]|nr:type II and III secretion system protein [Bacteroidota bacterium]MBU1113966.1 type II and III secretion system protein [Bacteroidota bacterium]MBU1797306.1 type II and III secretion system protein [Bacteroidota bacterium]